MCVWEENVYICLVNCHCILKIWNQRIFPIGKCTLNVTFFQTYIPVPVSATTLNISLNAAIFNAFICQHLRRHY